MEKGRFAACGSSSSVRQCSSLASCEHLSAVVPLGKEEKVGKVCKVCVSQQFVALCCQFFPVWARRQWSAAVWAPFWVVRHSSSRWFLLFLPRAHKTHSLARTIPTCQLFCASSALVLRTEKHSKVKQSKAKQRSAQQRSGRPNGGA